MVRRRHKIKFSVYITLTMINIFHKCKSKITIPEVCTILLKFFKSVQFSLMFSLFTKLYNHHHYLVSKYFHWPKNKPHTSIKLIESNLLPIPWKQTLYLLLSLQICLFWIFHINKNHIICAFLYLDLFIYHVFKVHPHYSMYQNFICFFI